MADRMLGKVAVVTGAASGMGKAIALAYLREGAKIVAADFNVEGLEALEKEADELGFADSICTIKCDVTSSADCDAAVALCVEKYGTYNVLSHNAGIGDNWKLVVDMEDSIWERQIAVNLTGSMNIARSSLKYFLPNEIKASMVMITSNAAVESSTGGAAYTAAKAGANALMKSIAFENGRSGIRCNSICPGPVSTNIHDGIERDPAVTAVHYAPGYNKHYAEWALKRVAFPDEIAPLAVYLGSDESSFMNSATIIIDGGVCLG